MPDSPHNLPRAEYVWPRLYALVVGALVVEIGLFYWLMVAFA